MALSTAASTAAIRKSSSDAAVQRAADFLADVAAELLQGVELGGVGGEVVVELRQDFLPHLLHLHFEDGVLAGQFRLLVLVGEGDLDLDLVARRGADQLVLEVVDQLARAERQQVVVGLAALEGLVVDEALEVHQHRVALLRGALDRLEAGEALADPIDLGVDHLLVDLFLLLADLEALVLAELRRRADADLELEGERLAFLLGGRDHVDLRFADRRHAGVEERRFVPLGQRVADRFGEHRANPIRWITSAGGALPLRKPGRRSSRAIARAVRLAARWTSCGGTSAWTSTRESGSSLRVVCMVG